MNINVLMNYFCTVFEKIIISILETNCFKTMDNQIEKVQILTDAELVFKNGKGLISEPYRKRIYRKCFNKVCWH